MRATKLPLALALTSLATAAVAVPACGGADPSDERGARRARPVLTAGPGQTKPPARPPVVMLVLDEFPTDALLGPDGHIDAGRYPNFARLARAGTWFPNAHTVYDSTTKAVPAILDGRTPAPGVPGTFEGHPRTVFDLFGPRGYRIVSSEEATAVCPPRFCPGAEPKGPDIVSLLNAGRPERLGRFLRAIRPGGPSFYFKHVLLPHGPHLYLPSGKAARAGRDPLPGSESVPGFYDRHITNYNQQRILLQIGFVDREIGRMLDGMQKHGILDESLIVITADHGLSSDVGVANRRVASAENVDEVAPVPLFIKAPGQRRGRTIGSYVRTTDVVPTIADILGLRMPYRADGRSAFSQAVRRRRSLVMVRRDFGAAIEVPARVIERRRRALLLDRLKRFGSGDWASLYTGVGPNRGLLGRPVSELARERDGKVRATIAGAGAVRAVRRHSELLPTQLAGPVTGGDAGSRRDIAVAVNGRIEAVSRTFHLRGSKQESFAVNVPEVSLQPGRNRVEVFEVRARSRLRLIGEV
ncbi:MAG: sulfatase-like hydrolase/transferase [Actinomycetota bacterium]|nr:sulfatase-like hydrolase/transferase [Actinomycetota bacterium]